MGMSPALLIPRQLGLPGLGKVLDLDADRGVTAAAIGYGVALNGSSQYLLYTGAACDPGTGDFTLAFVFNITSLPASGVTATILNGGTVGGDSDFLWIAINSDGDFLFYLGDANGLVTLWTSPFRPTVGVTYCVIAKYDRDGKLIVKVNGTPHDCGTLGHTQAVTPGQLAIGRLAYNASNYFPGWIDGVAYISRLTTDEEDAWLYNSGVWRHWVECGLAGTDGANLDATVVKGFWDFENAAALGDDSTSNNTDMTPAGTPTQVAGVNYSATGVGSWVDQTGGGNSPTQTVAGKLPTTTASSVNGHASVDFAAPQSLSVSFAAALAQPYTVFLVAQATAAGVMLDSSTGDSVSLSRAADRWEGTAGTALDSLSVDDSWHVFSLTVNGDTSILCVDGAEFGGAAGAAELTGVTLGADNAAANYLTGSVARVIVYNRELSAIERRRAHRVLARIYGLSTGRMKVRFGTDKFLCRIPWSATTDYVTGMDLAYELNTGTYVNSVPLFLGSGTVASTTADADLLSGPSITAHTTEDDDTAPVNIMGTYIGGNHGAAMIRQVTATTHGKDATDLGSDWTDASAVHWYLLRVVDADTLWFISDNASEATWEYGTNIDGNLTHSAGAAHTTGVTVAAEATAQLQPASEQLGTTLYRNGADAITEDGTYICDYVDVVHHYEIKDVDSVLAYVQAHVGEEVDFAASSVAGILDVSIRYRFQPNGAVTIHQSIEFLRDTTLSSNVSFLQKSSVTVPSSGTLHEYVPKAKAFAIGENNYDFSAIQDITSLGETIHFTSDRWTDGDAPPDRFTQFSKTAGGDKTYGFQCGYDITADDAIPSTRVTLTGNAMQIWHETKKQYPRLVSTDSAAFPTNIIPNGTVFSAITFRCPLNYGAFATPTAVCWYRVAGTYRVNLDFHANFDSVVVLPPELHGKTITVIEKHANVTIGSTTVPATGIAVTVVDGYGYAVLKLE